jgi:hypothetical protein
MLEGQAELQEVNARNLLSPYVSVRRVLGGASLLAFAFGLTLASAAPLGDVKFRTPSGNIGCLASFAPQPGLRCDIEGGVKPLPPAPKDCQLDWGLGFELAKTGTATVTCSGDTVMDAEARVIPSGTTWRQGGFACTSQTSSLRCSNAGGHGFFLSKERSGRF